MEGNNSDNNNIDIRINSEKIRDFLKGYRYAPGDFNLESFLHQKAESQRQNSSGGDDGKEYDASDEFYNQSHTTGDDKRQYNLRSARGILVWDDPILGGFNVKTWRDFGKLKSTNPSTSYCNYVFSKLPIKSKLFEYDVICFKLDNHKSVAGCTTILQCTQVTLIPRDLTLDLVHDIFDILDIRKKEERLSILAFGSWNEDYEYNKLEKEGKAGSFVINKDDLIQAIRDHSKKNSTMIFCDKFFNNDEIKRYYHAEHMNVISNYYKDEFVLQMNWSDIPKLYQMLITEPHRLCFHTENPFMHKVPKRYESICNASFITSSNGTIKLYEMDFDNMIRAYDEFGDQEMEVDDDDDATDIGNLLIFFYSNMIRR